MQVSARREMWLLVAMLLAVSPSGAAARFQPKFLIASTILDSKVMYQWRGKGAQSAEEPMRILIESGLLHPQGLAVDQQRQCLYVADPDARKIFSYQLTHRGTSLLAGPQEVAADGIESRWVSVDSLGSLYFSDEAANRILKLSASQLRRGKRVPAVVFDAISDPEVSVPGGVIADNFHAYWVNKQKGSAVGSLIEGSEVLLGHNPQIRQRPRAMSRNVEKSFGVCMSLNNIFYTQEHSSIYGIKKDGGEPVLISDNLSSPRGCAWDGDGSVYVADRAANAIYRFAGNMPKLSLAQMTVAAYMDGAFGVAVFSRSTRRAASAAVWLASALLLVATMSWTT
mmetsp:Transcript_62160/g.148286  ORF Transcript_62160/g.148286 Transcript_62160/m.148286 type:complete len:340 (-) Transcript_62160:57-1076(-)|eukprot:CAMPEP_0178397146 /NCGR_PEP_ID=MMETSP0689_2-20121128/14094_1 /TAXON_ID=160604 /ORGANISM="Amphidinium massartii, Strain CS-259" /LENGTH=339 /DNA_ID=CAMNT_0020017843 /DNA_START=74 /DNA_END=1093 /DNA_ORIENTATION=-